VLSGYKQQTQANTPRKRELNYKQKRNELPVMLIGMPALENSSSTELDISGGVPAAFSCCSPMPACMSAMQASLSGNTTQLQKHAAMVEAAQPALVIVVIEHSVTNLDGIVCLWPT
jgi:hypothetical protein